MSRSGYIDDCEYIGLYRANVGRSLGSKRGQAFLKELAAAMDAMTVKELISGELVDDVGSCCAIGTVCRSRAVDVAEVDATCPKSVGELLGISKIMAAEIAYENDEAGPLREEPCYRWKRVRNWVNEQIVSSS